MSTPTFCSAVWTLYRRELRTAFRERTILINCIFVPIVLYPLMMWVMFSAIVFVRGQQERFDVEVALIDLPAAHAALEETLGEGERIRVVEAPEEPAAAIGDGLLDAAVIFAPPPGDAAALAANAAVSVLYDGSRDRSIAARDRLLDALEHHRQRLLRREAVARGMDAAAWSRLAVVRQNVAEAKDVGAFVLSLMVPLFLIVMIGLGCFYPAIDATAGERERGTWETTLTLAVPRGAVVWAKYLYVATLGCLAGLLNLAALALSMRAVMAPILARAGDADLEIVFPWGALPAILLASVLLALFVAAGMMVFAAFARSFKEGSSMLTPFYLVIIMPPLLLQSPDLELDWTMAWIPVANVMLFIRDAMNDRLALGPAAVALAVEVVLVLASLAAARWILRQEDVITEGYEGGFGRFLKERVLRRGAAKES